MTANTYDHIVLTVRTGRAYVEAWTGYDGDSYWSRTLDRARRMTKRKAEFVARGLNDIIAGDVRVWCVPVDEAPTP